MGWGAEQTRFPEEKFRNASEGGRAPGRHWRELGDEVVADHPRSFKREQVIYDPSHCLPVPMRRPDACLRNGAPFKDWDLPPALAKVRAKLKVHPDSDRQFVKIPASTPDHGVATVAAVRAGAHQAGIASGDVVVDIRARGAETPPAPSITTPDAIHLKAEPCRRPDCRPILPLHAPRGGLQWRLRAKTHLVRRARDLGSDPPPASGAGR